MAVNNFTNRLIRLIEAVRTDSASHLENYQYRLDSLLQDALTFREIPDSVANGLVQANEILNMGSCHNTTSQRTVEAPSTSLTGGRPKYKITKEQLQFYRGKTLLSSAKLARFLVC